MKREEAIRKFKGIIGSLSISIAQADFYPSKAELNELCNMAIKALQGDMYCPNCGVRLVPENEYLEPTQTHVRLIDANALMEYCSNQKTKTISNNDIARFPTAQADRPHGEWIVKLGIPYCNNCEKGAIHESDFCPNCGVDMRGGDPE